MKRNAVAVAVGALFIAPAAQAQIVFGNDTIGTVQFYGKLYPQFMLGTSKGATQPLESVSTLISLTGTVPAGAPVTDAGSRQAITENVLSDLFAYLNDSPDLWCGTVQQIGQYISDQRKG